MIAPLIPDCLSGPCVGDSVFWVDDGVVTFGPVVGVVMLGVVSVLSFVIGGSVTLEDAVVVKFAVGSVTTKL